jgi:hypothetical protein
MVLSQVWSKETVRALHVPGSGFSPVDLPAHLNCMFARHAPSSRAHALAVNSPRFNLSHLALTWKSLGMAGLFSCLASGTVAGGGMSKAQLE